MIRFRRLSISVDFFQLILALACLGSVIGSMSEAQAASRRKVSKLPASGSFKEIAEKELQVASPDRTAPDSKSLVTVHASALDETSRSRGISVGVWIESFSPAGDAILVTGDRYRLADGGNLPAFGMEICGRSEWDRLAGMRVGACASGGFATRAAELVTGSGMTIQGVRQAYGLIGLPVFAEVAPLPWRGIFAGASVGPGYSVFSQSAADTAANASASGPFLAFGPHLGWETKGGFYLKASYARHARIASAPDTGTQANHFMLATGIRL